MQNRETDMANVIEYVKDSYTELVERVHPAPSSCRIRLVFIASARCGHRLRHGLGVRREQR